MNSSVCSYQEEFQPTRSILNSFNLEPGITDDIETEDKLNSNSSTSAVQNEIENQTIDSIVSLKDLEYFPKSQFHTTLLTIMGKREIDDGARSVSIPNFMCAYVLALHDKIEEQLSSNAAVSFILDPPKNDSETIQLTQKIFKNQNEKLDTLITYLSSNPTSIIYGSLIEIVEKFDEPLFTISEDTLSYCKNVPLYSKSNQTVQDIYDEIYDRAMSYMPPKTETGLNKDNKKSSKSMPRFKNLVQHVTCLPNLGNKQEAFHVDDLMQSFFLRKHMTKEEDFKLRNELHLLLHKDIKTATHSRTHRNLIRYLIRNIVFFIRRYVNTKVAMYRNVFKLSCADVFYDIFPKLFESACKEVSLVFGPRLIKTQNNRKVDSINVFNNILHITMDNVWMSQQSRRAIVREQGHLKCHRDCFCEMGTKRNDTFAIRHKSSH